MNTTSANISSIDKFKAACRRHCEIIETCLLDFEKYGIRDLLHNTSNSINQIRIASKASDIENAVKLITAMQAVITYAIEEKIDLYPKDIDILLRSNDLFFGILQFTSEEVRDLFEHEEVIISEFLNEIKSCIAPYRIKKKVEKKKVDENRLKRDEQENKQILLEKFKFELVKSTNTIEHTLENLQEDSGAIDIIPVANALNTIKGAAISAGISKAFDLADSMQEFVAYTADNNIPISSYQMDMLLRCNRLFKEIAAGSAIALIDKFTEYNDFIDNYSSFLNNFLSDKDIATKSASSKLLANDDLFENFEKPANNLKLSEKQIFFGYKSNKLDESNKYNRLLESSIGIISNLSPMHNAVTSIKDLKLNIREIQLISNDILYNITNTERITKYVFDISEKLDGIISKLDENTSFIDKAGNLIKNQIDVVYSNLFNLRSIAFGDLILGFNELAFDLAKYSNKKVKLKLIGRFVRVGAEIAPVLEIVLPQILRYIIMSSLEMPEDRVEQRKRDNAEIIVTAQLISGRLVIEFEDDGKGLDANSQARALESIISMVKNNNGTIEIRSQEGVGTKTTLTFDLHYILLKSLIFEVGGNLYAMQIIDTEGMLFIEDASPEQMEKLKPIDMRKLFRVEGEYFSTNRPALVVRNYHDDYALIFDKFICEAELAPTKPNKLFGRSPFINSTAIFNDSPVIILDKSKLLNAFEKVSV